MLNDYHLELARTEDADAIAALHAESWRSAYRALVPDVILGDTLDAERQKAWRDRFAAPDANRRFTLMAVCDNRLVGFTCVLADADPPHGPLLDNLHVKPGWRGRGIGAKLLHESRVWVRQIAPGQPMHLWVIEDNMPSRAFYDAQGGVVGDRRINVMAGVEVPALRYTWPALPV